MAKPKKQCRNEKGDGTFRQRPNGTFDIGLYMSMNMVKQSVNHFMGRVMFYVLKKRKHFFMI